MHISSKDNSHIKRALKLAVDPKFRQQHQQSIAYGEHLVKEALQLGLVDKIFIDENKLNEYSNLIANFSAAQVMLVTSQVMHKLNILESPVAIIALVNLPPRPELSEAYQADCLVLEAVQDPGNLGTILRAAQASGVKHVLLSPNCVDIANPKVLRASQGIQFALKIYTKVDLAEFLVNYPGQVLALTPHAKSSLYEQNLTTNCALVFGNEGNGLSPQLLAMLKQQIKIPMPGNAESLNLAMAVTITVFEMVRQRFNGSN
jgi:TrmH family RNA methyltransferase